MKNIKNTFKILKYNLDTLISFEILFKLLITMIVFKILRLGFKLTMNVSSLKYLTLENLKQLLLNPITMLISIALIIFLTLITLFDTATIIIIADASFHKKKLKLKNAIKMTFKKCKNLLKLKNILIAIILLVLIPILDLGVESNLIVKFDLPEFIIDYIVSNNLYSFTIIGIYFILAFLLMRWIYTIHYMVLEDKDFIEAIKCSSNLSKKNKFKDIIKILLIKLLISCMIISLILIGVVLILVSNRFFNNIPTLNNILISVIGLFTIILFIFFSIISNSIGYIIVSTLFYEHKSYIGEEIKELQFEEKTKRKSIGFYIFIVFIISLLIYLGSIFTNQITNGNIIKIIEELSNIKITKNIEITAHRGASSAYPENTMSAFRGAKELGADWIELDVQQTKDHKIVVSHDSNLSRVTGVNKEIIDSNYDEIENLDAGSFFKEEFAGEKIPLLEEVLDFASTNNIKLNIELKPTGKEVNFEKEVIELIEKYNFEDKCIVTSLNYKVLENTKKINPKIKTAYVMSLAIGQITDIEYVDIFSVEASNVNENLVNQIHSKNKQILVWTVNTEESIKKMINMDVDNIITDNIILGRELVNKGNDSNVLNEIISIISI